MILQSPRRALAARFFAASIRAWDSPASVLRVLLETTLFNIGMFDIAHLLKMGASSTHGTPRSSALHQTLRLTIVTRRRRPFRRGGYAAAGRMVESVTSN